MQVLRLVLREVGPLTTVGAVLGFLGAVVMVKLLSALPSIFVESLNVGTNDPLLLAPLLLAALAIVASYLPARRSTRIDPVKALREE